MSGAGEAEGDESAPATEAASEGACDPCRRVFDDLSLKLVSALEAHPAVGAVELYSAPAVTRIQLGEWEARNRGCCLPEDYKALLAISNGITVRWTLLFDGEERPFGVVHINALGQLQRLPEAALVGLAVPDPLGVGAAAASGPPQGGGGACGSSGAARPGDGAQRRFLGAFDLDSECGAGRVALVFWEEADGDLQTRGPQVWFQDLEGRWHFMAGSFADYFRLVAVHLGVPQWQYAFADAGLVPAASHWLAFFCPDRLNVATAQSPAGRGRGAASSARSTPPRWSRLRSIAAASAAAPAVRGGRRRTGVRAERPLSASRMRPGQV